MLVAAVPAGGAVSTLSDDAEFLTTDEVAKRLRVHPTTILRRLGAVDDADPERIPAVRVGRIWRIPRANSRNGSLAPARPVDDRAAATAVLSAGRADHFSRKGGDLNAGEEEGCQEDREEEGEEEVALIP